MFSVGEKIGRLTITGIKVPGTYRTAVYECTCECGKVVTRSHSTLHAAKRRGSISSCGCYSQSYLRPGNAELCKKAGSHRKDAFVNGSNIQMTLREGTIKSNSSGHQGVTWSKAARKWHVFLGYQNYRTNLGLYEDLDQAVRIRKLAEEAVVNGTFEDFYFSIRGFHLGEVQHKQFKNKKS